MSDNEMKVSQLNDQIKAISATLQATQKLLNETLNARIQLETQVIMLQRTITEHVVEIEDLKKKNAVLNQDNARLLNNITELDAKVTALSPTAQPQLQAVN